MSDAVPPWRSFSSAGSATDADTDDSAAAGRLNDGPSGADRADRRATEGPRGAVASLVRGADRWAVGLVAVFALGAAALGATSVAMVVAFTGLTNVASSQAGHIAATASLETLDEIAAFGDGVGADLAQPRELVVDVAGGVVAPGLHRLRPGDRVGDAIIAAGGFGPRADLATASRLLNLAAPLSDGAKVLVPELGSTQVASPDDGRIDLNRADGAALESLPGIGPVTAQRILDARAEARFGKIADLRSRGIVGDAVFERLKGLVRAGP